MTDFSTLKNLVLMRGLPGAGKSSLARLLVGTGDCAMFSIDDFFTNKHGLYAFEFDKNHLAYEDCIQRTEAAMRAGVRKVFVHNTFVYNWEMEPYFKLATKHNYALHVLTVEKYHNSANVHEVSEHQIIKMAEKYRVKLY